MGQILTIILDALRLLRSQAIFYISLGISAFMALVLLCIGFDEQGVSLFFGAAHVSTDLLGQGSEWNRVFYLGLFQVFGVGVWLGWGAIILGLISTASLFPSYQKSTRVGIELAKPLGRWKLFLTRYVGGLSFMVLQLILFCGVAWLAVGWRLNLWLGEIWLAVPVVTLAFSFVYAVLVLVGTWTRSTLAGLVAALIVWMAASLTGFAEKQLYTMVELGEVTHAMERAQHDRWDEEMTAGQENAVTLTSSGLSDEQRRGNDLLSEQSADNAPGEGQRELGSTIQPEQSSGGVGGEFGETMKKFHRVAQGLYTPMPKTKPTTAIVGRLLSRQATVDGVVYPLNSATLFALLGGMPPPPEMGAFLVAQDERHSIWWIIGTSLGFELVMVGIAGWIFARRDF